MHVSRLDDLQTAARQVGGDADSAISALGQLLSDNEEAVQEAVAWGNESAARLLDGPGKASLAEAMQLLQWAREKLTEYVAAVEWTKNGGGLLLRQSGGPPSSTTTAPSSPLPFARLPNADSAVIDSEKFTAYSMNPAHPANRGKWKAWGRLGYDVTGNRDGTAADVTRQMRRQLPYVEARQSDTTEYGERYNASFLITGPNGRCGTLETRWQVDRGTTTPRLVTNWLRVHREEDE